MQRTVGNQRVTRLIGFDFDGLTYAQADVEMERGPERNRIKRNHKFL